MHKKILLIVSVIYIVLGIGSLSAKAKVEKMPKSFVDVAVLIPSAVYDIRYFGTDNFVGAKVDGYEAAKCLLTKKAAEKLAEVEKDLELFGYKLRIYDCYRPQAAVDHFIRWGENAKDTKTKARYYPDFNNKADLFNGYIAKKSGHTRGSVIDLTIDGLDMGTPFDLLGMQSNTAYPKISKQARANRLLLKTVMEKHGFENYDKEWWHYKFAKEPYPKKYFNFPVR